MHVTSQEARSALTEQNDAQNLQEFTLDDVSCNFYDYSLITANNL